MGAIIRFSNPMRESELSMVECFDDGPWWWVLGAQAEMHGWSALHMPCTLQLAPGSGCWRRQGAVTRVPCVLNHAPLAGQRGKLAAYLLQWQALCVLLVRAWACHSGERQHARAPRARSARPHTAPPSPSRAPPQAGGNHGAHG